MTDDERLAAIRARYDEAVLLQRSTFHETSRRASAWRASAEDVEWLLDRLAEVTAERDEARETAREYRHGYDAMLLDYANAAKQRDKVEAALARVEALCDEQSEQLTVDGPNRYVPIRKVRAALAVS